ncbi:Gfo/Idh/MocA family protein [Mesobacillus maritimus]|uniref:Gfo/Idh/MocA family oxidoreductase n=1 Tax=Mesobacillus maritimus TaxID=1643336 RepID=A0ABS7KA93_9BACI|nr:Gfo/Idh/MocA family oxidoreductase [Mesobacillus maritimus]MBY0099172.1 Gfo/Idh/MocA family oxidoreductase [Mesobacillus maritimus]
MLKLGIIGVGNIARKAYLPVLSTLKDVELHVFTRSQQTLAYLREFYRFTYLHDSLEKLINSEITAAFVHSSTDSHYEIIKELLKHDIHVYVEKPITNYYETTKELVEMAGSKNRMLTAGFNRRFAPAYQKLKEIEQPNMIIMQKNRISSPGNIREIVFDDFIHVIDTVRLYQSKPVNEIIVTGKIRDGLLYQVAAQFITEDEVGVAIMNRDSGVNEEIIEVMSSTEKGRVVNMVDLSIKKGLHDTHHSFGDWEGTLFKRGFEPMIHEVIKSMRLGASPPIQGEVVLSTHELCEKVVRELEKIN